MPKLENMHFKTLLKRHRKIQKELNALDDGFFISDMKRAKVLMERSEKILFAMELKNDIDYAKTKSN